MPFYVSPEQQMKDKADFARKAITRGRSGVVIDYDAGFLFVSPNPSRALHKFSELYDRIAFAAAGRYNEFDRLRQAGVRYADLTGYQYDRQDVTSRGLANWYAQVLGTIFIESNKPLEVEMAIAEVGDTAADDQIYRITFDGTITEEHHYLVMGGQADPVAAVLKERYAEGATLAGAMAVATAALAAGQGNGAEQTEITAASLEVATLDRSRTSHRMFRRLSGPRLEELLAQARASAPASPAPAAPADAGTAGTSSAGPGNGGNGNGGPANGGPANGGPGSGGTGNGTPEPGSADSGGSPGQ
jgi:proteasome alpha subunit